MLMPLPNHGTLPLILLESLHDSRLMLGAGSSSGLNSSRSSQVVAGWGRPAGVSLSVHQ